MWDERYGAEGFAYGTEPNDFLREVVDRLTPGATLCIAEGEGRNACFLAAKGFDVVAVDQSAVGMAKAAQLAADRGVSIRTEVADLARYAWPRETYATVVSIFAHMPSAVRAEVHRGVVTALKPGGHLVLEAYTPAQIGRGTGGPPVPDLTMSLDTLRAELDGLRFDIGREVVRSVIEGRYHTGEAAVVQVLATKI